MLSFLWRLFTSDRKQSEWHNHSWFIRQHDRTRMPIVFWGIRLNKGSGGYGGYRR